MSGAGKLGLGLENVAGGGVFFSPQRAQSQGASGGEIFFVTRGREGKSIRCVHGVLWASRGRESAGATPVWRTWMQLRSEGHEPRP